MVRRIITSMKKSLLIEALKIASKKFKNHSEKYIHYSFIIQNNKIIEWGMNRPGHPAKHYGYNKKSIDPTFVAKIHAEIDAFQKAKGLLNKTKYFDIINIRVNKEGKLRISKPCICCFHLLKELGCRNFYYTNEEKFEIC